MKVEKGVLALAVFPLAGLLISPISALAHDEHGRFHADLNAEHEEGHDELDAEHQADHEQVLVGTPGL